MRIACEVLYKYSDENLFYILNKSLENLGFIPNYYSVIFNQFKKAENDIPYIETELLKLFNKSENPESIRIFDQLYSENIVPSNRKWFKLSLNIEAEEEFQETIGNSIRIEWSNFDLTFLLKSTFFDKLTNDKNLIYCYIYNQDDVMEQSNTVYNQFENKIAKKK